MQSKLRQEFLFFGCCDLLLKQLKRLFSYRMTFFSVALQSFRTLAASHIGGFLSYLDTW
jgi:hypothetical protein